MLQIRNKSLFETALTLGTFPDGRDALFVAVKGTFSLPLPNGRVELAEQQCPVVLANVPDPSDKKWIKYPADLVMGKLGTDIGLVGSGYQHHSLAREDLTASIRVGPVARRVSIATSSSDKRELCGKVFKIPLPSSCFGFLSPAVRSRRKYAGTYDKRWLEQQSPLLPEDFDLRFFNCAHPDLIVDPHLQGGEVVRLTKLTPQGDLTFSLPSLQVSLNYRIGDERLVRKTELWTLLFEPDEQRFSMLWGDSLAIGKQPSRVREIAVDVIGEPGLNLMASAEGA